MDWQLICENIANLYPNIAKEKLEKGLCQGLAMLYAQGVFCGEQALVKRQLALLSQSTWHLLGKPYYELSKVIESAFAIKRDIYGSGGRYQAQVYVDTRAFLDTLLSFQGSFDSFSHQNASITTPYLIPKKLEPNKHWHLLYENFFSGTKEYYNQKIAAIFAAAQKKLRQEHRQKLVMLIRSQDHAIALSQSTFVYQLHDHGDTFDVNEKALGSLLYTSFDVSEYVDSLLLSISLYTMPSFLKMPINPLKVHPVISYYFKSIRPHLIQQSYQAEGGRYQSLTTALKNFTQQRVPQGVESVNTLTLPPYLVTSFIKLIISWVLLLGNGKHQDALATFYLFEQYTNDYRSLIGVSSPDSSMTPLFMACREGHLLVVMALLKSGQLDPDQTDEKGHTPFYYACEGGHLAVVQVLLQTAGVDPNKRDFYDQTPLYIACTEGHLAVVQALQLSGRIDPKNTRRFCDTPLHAACEKGRLDLVEVLLKIDNIESDNMNSKYKTPLYIAYEKGHSSIVQVLLKNGKADPNKAHEDGYTILHIACAEGDLAVVQGLLQIDKVEPDKVDKYGETPLHMACEEGCFAEEDRLAVVRALLQSGKVDPNKKNRQGKTPLKIAKKYRHWLVASALLENKKAKIKQTKGNGENSCNIL